MGCSAKKESQEISRRSKGSNLWRNKGKKGRPHSKKEKKNVSSSRELCMYMTSK